MCAHMYVLLCMQPRMQICCGALKKTRKKTPQEPEQKSFWKDVHPLNNFTSLFVCMQSPVQICCGALKIKKTQRNSSPKRTPSGTPCIHSTTQRLYLCVCNHACRFAVVPYKKKSSGARKEHHLESCASALQLDFCVWLSSTHNEGAWKKARKYI